MQHSDWYDLKFLESTTNLKPLIKRSTGRIPSTKTANQIAVCIQQGRLFFEAAAAAPLQIKPLQLYYGILGFSKAIILARNVSSISTLVAAHGLSDVSSHDSGLEQLIARFGKRGTFQEFDNAA